MSQSLLPLWELFHEFALLSFIAFGGASALLPELHRVVVEQHHWLTDTAFTQLFAIAQAAPGPNVLVITLIGWEVAGVAGALVSTLAMCLPMSVVIFLLYGHWERFRAARWRQAIQWGVAPLAVGLVLSSGGLIALSSGGGLWGLGLTVITVLLSLNSKLHPLWLIALGAVCGLLAGGLGLV